jgi:ABC-type transport system involved in cytochrome c biogenesis permease subunit
LIAHRLAADGDTFEVLQAVLDTQFWLATHVVCITFGYATTFLAGGLGILYIARGLATPSLTKQTGSELSRMIYGTLCFAIFFSFFGTVLGGLWADDSWGRFWGWDPKENGALIIVLWNALILHARWDRLIRDRGLAVLAVVGNIVTAWSWFGVNELGVGLHSYGFTEGRLRTLGFVVLGHLALVAAGGLPLSMWWSYRRNAELKGDGEGGAAA